MYHSFISIQNRIGEIDNLCCTTNEIFFVQKNLTLVDLKGKHKDTFFLEEEKEKQKRKPDIQEYPKTRKVESVKLKNKRKTKKNRYYVIKEVEKDSVKKVCM